MERKAPPEGEIIYLCKEEQLIINIVKGMLGYIVFMICLCHC